MRPGLHAALVAAFSHVPKILQQGQEGGKIVAGDPVRLALTLSAALHGLVAFSIEGKVKVMGVPLKTVVPATV